MKVEAIDYGDRRVYTVAAFNRGVADWLARFPSIWVEGEITELRRQSGWQSVFLTLKDPDEGACLAVTMLRSRFDALRLDLVDGDRVHVFGRPELFAHRGDFRLRALSIERFGLGDHLARLERLKRQLASEGIFAQERKRRLPRLPRRVGLVTGNDAAAKRDVLTAISSRFPPARILVVETYVQGPRAASAVMEAMASLAAAPEVDVIVLARGGGSVEDLLPFSDERLVRAVASCPVPVVTAVGHEQDTPLCDLAADARAATPTAVARLVVPDHAEVIERLDRAAAALERGARGQIRRAGSVLEPLADRLRRAPALALERKRARLESVGGRLRALSPASTLERGYAIVRSGRDVVRSSGAVAAGARVHVRLAQGGFEADVRAVDP